MVFTLVMDFFGLKLGSQIQEVFLGLEKLNEHGGFWNVPRSTGVLLSGLVSLLQAKSVLEIGTSIGYSGIFLAEAARRNGGLLYTVESHEGRFEMARDSFLRCGLGEAVVQVKGHAPEVFEGELKGIMFDFVFLDATKGEYEDYLQAILPVLEERGLIVADNVLSHKDELYPFMRRVEEESRLRSLLLEIDSGLLLAFKYL